MVTGTANICTQTRRQCSGVGELSYKDGTMDDAFSLKSFMYMDI